MSTWGLLTPQYSFAFFDGFEWFVPYGQPVDPAAVSAISSLPKIRAPLVKIDKETIRRIREAAKVDDKLLLLGRTSQLEENLLVFAKLKIASKARSYMERVEDKISTLEPELRVKVQTELKATFEAIANNPYLKKIPLSNVFPAALYLVCRKKKIDCRADTISGHYNFPVKRLLSLYKKLVFELNARIPIRSPRELIESSMSRGEVPRRLGTKAIDILNQCATSGKNPRTLAATAVFLAKVDDKPTQAQLSKIFGVSSVSIRNTARRLKESCEILD